ncbi:acyltransferase family protein [Viscerimonas tarda]
MTIFPPNTGKERNLYIDAIKGITILSTVFIHTVYPSGFAYVPETVRMLSLLVDVPVFFFLSGLTSSSNVEKTIYRLIKLQITYMIFVTLVFILQSLISGQIELPHLFGWYIHKYENFGFFLLVQYSLWYLEIYFIVSFFAVLTLKYLSGRERGLLTILLFLFVCFFTVYHRPQGNTDYVCFYLAIFLIAHRCKDIFIKKPFIIIGYLLLGVLVSFLFLKTSINLQKHKFPPTIFYGIASSLSLFTVFVLKNRWKVKKQNILTYIGQHSIFFYFSQGINSSILYTLVEPLKSYHWYLMLPIMFAVNVVGAVAIGIILLKIDGWCWRLLRKVRGILSSFGTAA